MQQSPSSAPGTRSRDVFLLKHRPQPSEAQEGVAFFGRAGQAVLKSLQRLRVDPMAVYGTNCVKFAEGAADEEARGWLTRELHIVQPKLVVVMGEDALAFLNDLEFPLSQPVEQTIGELQQFTPTIQALVVPDIDTSLDEAPGRLRSGTPSRCSAPGGRSCLPTEGRRAASRSSRSLAALVA